jgi:PHD/YefM family antitoxin component YafN of YafNO toxin-antitoxin module
VVIRRQNRDVAVVLSIADYDRLRAVNVEAFQRFTDRVGAKARQRGLTERKLTTLLDGDC